MSFSQRLMKFIQHNLIRGTQLVELDESEPLIERGVLDSMGLLQVLTFIEGETGIRVPDDEMLPDNFRTISSIEQMVQRLRAKRISSPGSTS